MVPFGARILAFTLVLAGAAAPAAAQRTGDVFVGGLVAADVQRHPEVTGSGTVASPALSGTTAAGSVLGGVFLSDRFSARLEQGWSGEHAGAAVSSIGPATTRLEQRVRMSTTAVMAGYDLPSGRAVRLALMAGVVIARERRRMRSELEFTLPPGLQLPPGVQVPPGLPLPPGVRVPPVFEFPVFEPEIIDQSATSYRGGAALGADADWRVRPRLTVAPGLRVLIVGNVLSLRPSVSARWTF